MDLTTQIEIGTYDELHENIFDNSQNTGIAFELVI